MKGGGSLAPRAGGAASGWRLVYEVDFADEADQTPASSLLSFGGVSWTVEGAAQDTAGGPKIASGTLVISPDIATNVARSSTGKRYAPILHSTLTNLGVSFSSLGSHQLLVNIEIAAWSPGATQEAVRVGLESSAGPLGSGSGGRGVSGGTAYQSTQRGGSIVFQDSSGTASSDSTASVAVRSMACVFAGVGVSVYSSATPGALDGYEKVLAASHQNQGGMRGNTTVPTLDRIMLVAESPDASSGPVVTISSIRVWEKT